MMVLFILRLLKVHDEAVLIRGCESQNGTDISDISLVTPELPSNSGHVNNCL